jgi:hypothetical protein
MGAYLNFWLFFTCNRQTAVKYKKVYKKLITPKALKMIF